MIALVGLCLAGCSVGFISQLLRVAPLGCEDETGFHFLPHTSAGNSAKTTEKPLRTARAFVGIELRLRSEALSVT